MSAAEERLYGLMEVAERQQAAAQAALEGLAAERAALARERGALAGTVRDLELGTRAAVHSAVADSLAAAATDGVAAVRTATQPLLGQLAGVADQAAQTEVALRAAVRWVSWRLWGWTFGLAVALPVAGWLLSNAVLWRDQGAIDAARAQKAALQAEIEGLQANRDSWEKGACCRSLSHVGQNAGSA